MAGEFLHVKLSNDISFMYGMVQVGGWGTCGQGWGEYYSGTRFAQNYKHEYTKNIVLEYYLSTDFPVLVLVCSVLAPALSASNDPWPLCPLLLTWFNFNPSMNK